MTMIFENILVAKDQFYPRQKPPGFVGLRKPVSKHRCWLSRKTAPPDDLIDLRRNSQNYLEIELEGFRK